MGWLFALSALALAGFGVYLGRFQRWNSWDVLCSPFALLGDIAARCIAPWDYARTWGFSGVCFLFLAISYLMCSQLGQLRLAQDDDTTTPRSREPDSSITPMHPTT